MSRVAKMPILIPTNVSVTINDKLISVSGKNGKLTRTFNKVVKIEKIDNIIKFDVYVDNDQSWAQAGTARSILNAMIIGVTKGFNKKLQLVGIGYRVIIEKNVIILSLGFSHPINYRLPTDIFAECPSQTEIILKGADKQVVGQVAANIRAYRIPDPYKGKGIRYHNESIRIKEAKKK